MELDQQKQAERFVQQFKQIDFQVPFENLKRQTVQVDGTKYYKDLYLVQKLLPTLTEGMEMLSKQLEEIMNNTDEIDPQVRSRFNPCLFLGQYLMRRNHNLNPNSPLTKLLTTYAHTENFNRLFVTRFETMHRIFAKSIGKDKKTCDISQLKLYARDIDHLLDCKGELKNYLSNSKQLSKNKDQIKLNDILDELAKFLVTKTALKEKDVQKIINNYVS